MHVLISGAGIAGLTGALGLGRRGHDVTVVEYADHFRLEGTPVDIRGEAIETVDRMGLLEKIHAHRLQMSESSRFVDADGAPVGRVPLADNGSDDIEILREDLVRILADALPDAVTIRFGDSIQTLTDDGDDVHVGFESGRTGRYDLVLGADGQHSAVRSLVFGPEQDYLRHLGVYFALANLPADVWSEHANSIYNVPDRLAGIFRYKNKTVAVFEFRSEPLDYDHRDLEAQKQILLDAFAGHSSWKIPQLLDAARADPEFFFDAASQIHLPSWHRGRVALIGDAGYCPAFLSGRGTSLALTGAHFLAEELQAGGQAHIADLTAAFERYEARQRPHVTFAQGIVDRGRDHLLPATWAEIAARNTRLQSSGHQ
ncbi:FAD-dependent monooxygenase [Mycobacterium sp. 21AC1]|uniref:FAD-dependent monooxygenase n=1 Tax=[Mycobacterium] appelbergii TaxID=2939269 RepID=UPI002938F0CE|nr:FAD-dependent monooxygenase [Mycobacterium sp. 21AC1]MDV3129962.1 FAD-dependent monooxygenase [Mycobacterium sp. 21AC1]